MSIDYIITDKNKKVVRNYNAGMHKFNFYTYHRVLTATIIVKTKKKYKRSTTKKNK